MHDISEMKNTTTKKNGNLFLAVMVGGHVIAIGFFIVLNLAKLTTWTSPLFWLSLLTIDCFIIGLRYMAGTTVTKEKKRNNHIILGPQPLDEIIKLRFIESEGIKVQPSRKEKAELTEGWSGRTDQHRSPIYTRMMYYDMDNSHYWVAIRQDPPHMWGYLPEHKATTEEKEKLIQRLTDRPIITTEETIKEVDAFNNVVREKTTKAPLKEVPDTLPDLNTG